MPTATLMVFIGGLIFSAIFGGVCGYYALKLLRRIETDQRKAQRTAQTAAAATQPPDEKQQA